MSDLLMPWSELFNPTVKQKEALKLITNHRFLLYGGPRGGGKSYLLRWWLLQRLLEFHVAGLERVPVLLGCESYPTLVDRQISKIQKEFPSWLGEVKKTQEAGLGFYLKEEYGAGRILLRNFDDPNKYIGAEYAAVGIDQIEKNTVDVFNILRGSLRYPGIPQPKMMATANPGGIGHRWVKAFWIDKRYPPELEFLAPEFVYVHAAPQDNPHLDERYWTEDLASLPPNLKKAWLEGDWDILAGTAFPQFNESHICEPFDIPSSNLNFLGIDWGYSNPYAALWVSKDLNTGRHYIYREDYAKMLTDAQQARRIKDMTMENIAINYADPAMWTPKTFRNIVTSSADEYAAEGVFLTQGERSRIGGKRKIDRLLEPMPDGKPGLMVFKTCTNFIATFPYLIVDERNPEDVDTKQEDDHLYDALRYALSGLTNRPVVPRKRTASPFERRQKVL